MQITADHTIRFIKGAAAAVKEQRDYLTELDAAIGDADHGINLDRGFSAVVTNLPNVAGKDIGAILEMVSATLLSKVGGASGPLYGLAFRRASRVTAGRFELTPEELVQALGAGLEGIQSIGKSGRGDKTMIDTIGPALDALSSAIEAGDELLPAMHKALAAAEEGMLATIPMCATRGRAALLVERSIGHQDPGATSAYIMFKALLETFESDE